MAKLTEKSRVIFDWLTEIGDAKVTAADIGEALGIENPRSVIGTVNGLQKRGLVQRTEAEVKLTDGTHKKVKFISLTEKGKAFDPDADEE